MIELGEVHVYMVDPHNLDLIRGELENLILQNSSISYGYYTDTRTSAKISTFGSNYIEGSWLRIVLKNGEKERELGTYIVEGVPEITEQNGGRVYQYDLQSVLWGLSDDACLWHFAIGIGAHVLDVFKKICQTVDKKYLIGAGARDYIYSASKIFEAGESYLSFLFDICEASGNRLGVDGHGRITIHPYTEPSRLTPAWDLDVDAEDTPLLNSAMVESTTDDVPGRVLVTHSSNNQEILAYAQQPSKSKYSSDFRGYMKTEKVQVSDMQPATYARAQQIANEKLRSKMAVTTLKCSALYFPCECGQAVYLTRSGDRKKYLIQSIDPLNLKDLTMGLTLREV